jgi:hypothetical protein
LHDTLMMDAETTEECESIVICDENYFVDGVFWFVTSTNLL